LFNVAYAQHISGTVTSQNEPINGASVLWKHHGIGSITNSEGKFILVLSQNITPQDSIVFSCTGYAPVIISANEALKNKELKITLTEIINNLSDVVITNLSLNELLDSIENHNLKKIISPVILSGYYKEIVYSDSLCTEFSDALCEYYFNHNLNNKVQLKINASRCLSSKFINTDRHDAKSNLDSKIDPRGAFQIALLYGMIGRYLTEKDLPFYKYKMEEDSNTTKITIFPKEYSSKHYYKLILLLTKDFTLRHCHLEIPDTAVDMMDTHSLLGIHAKITGLVIDVSYLENYENIYPNSFSLQFSENLWGKFLGVTFNEKFKQESEFVTTKVDNSDTVKDFDKSVLYKKGNICENGISMNDSLLANYNMILPTQTERTLIKGMK
jgi:hypothetical protein